MRWWLAAVSEFAVGARETRQTPALARVLIAIGAVLAGTCRSAPAAVPPPGTGLAGIQALSTGLAERVVWASVFSLVALAGPTPEFEAPDVAAPRNSHVYHLAVGATFAVMRLVVAESLNVYGTRNVKQHQRQQAP